MYSIYKAHIKLEWITNDHEHEIKFQPVNTQEKLTGIFKQLLPWAKFQYDRVGKRRRKWHEYNHTCVTYMNTSRINAVYRNDSFMRIVHALFARRLGLAQLYVNEWKPQTSTTKTKTREQTESAESKAWNILLLNQSKKRRIPNMMEIRDRLTEHYGSRVSVTLLDHDTVQKGRKSMKLKDQLRFFAESDIIITPHGAAIINAIACRVRHTHVIEICPPYYHCNPLMWDKCWMQGYCPGYYSRLLSRYVHFHGYVYEMDGYTCHNMMNVSRDKRACHRFVLPMRKCSNLPAVNASALIRIIDTRIMDLMGGTTTAIHYSDHTDLGMYSSTNSSNDSGRSNGRYLKDLSQSDECAYIHKLNSSADDYEWPENWFGFWNVSDSDLGL